MIPSHNHQKTSTACTASTYKHYYCKGACRLYDIKLSALLSLECNGFGQDVQGNVQTGSKYLQNRYQRSEAQSPRANIRRSHGSRLK